MERILKFLNYWLGKLYIPCPIPADKQAHAISGLILFTAMSVLFGMELALIWLFIIAICKEIYDYFHPDKHTCDLWDVVATTIIPSIIYFMNALF